MFFLRPLFSAFIYIALIWNINHAYSAEKTFAQQVEIDDSFEKVNVISGATIVALNTVLDRLMLDDNYENLEKQIKNLKISIWKKNDQLKIRISNETSVNCSRNKDLPRHYFGIPKCGVYLHAEVDLSFFIITKYIRMFRDD